ncbi:hypothetical protein Mgra_00008845 [Meloidogyne graminicola]|uniref:Uncharacterized protein n=1 Tax=Meloidogyne graminicola TaxID=189291 RepID=A0A8S9ZEI6_9BILA|nr:hypothetical protein Mgra_00008845 [Meloidogyne graminicola]
MKEEKCGITFDLDSEIVSQLKEHLKDYHLINISNSNEENDLEEDEEPKRRSNKKSFIWQNYTINNVNGEKIAYCNLNDKNGNKCEKNFRVLTNSNISIKYHFAHDHIYGLKNSKL